ncbi:MAG: peptide chain release factor N(5)-glutamine methyltransferase [Lachnospiraceae bacterium]|nr:peptide chain release factor N(5)-glutamine methyltransferase [Lachnospiraceae bacterium]
MTVAKLLAEGEEILRKEGITDHRIDAVLLLEHVLKKDRTYIKAHPGADVTEDEEKDYKVFIAGRAEHIPLQHITGTVWFMGLPFKVTPDVLIPRFDTEFVTEEVLKEVSDGDRVLDLCTGSGCILLSVMSYKNDIEGVGTDISKEALKVAEENAKSLKKDPVLLCSDMFEKVEGTFDCIVSNPPYIKSADINGLEIEVRDHEPRTALDGGEDGLDFYRIIADLAADHLKKEGRIILEIGYDEGEDVRRIFEEKGYRDIRIIRDYAGNERVMKCLNR